MNKFFIFYVAATVFLAGCVMPDPREEQRMRDSESILAQDLEAANSIPVAQRQQNMIQQERFRIKNSNPMNNYNILKRGQ